MTTKLLRFEGYSDKDFGEFEWCYISMGRTLEEPKVPWFVYPNDEKTNGPTVVGEWHEHDRTWRITVRMDDRFETNMPGVRFWYTDTVTVERPLGSGKIFKTEVLHMEVPADTSLWNPKMNSW